MFNSHTIIKVVTTVLVIFSLLSCSQEETAINSTSPLLSDEPILEQLATNYEQLPEKAITYSVDKQVYAQYTKPTSKYAHGILGDKIEAQQLVVVMDSIIYEMTLSGNYVFEDIAPRLYDVDGDSVLEVITIRSHVSLGAGIMIYKIVDEKLTEYAFVPEIGTANRWLNIAAISDMDGDGVVELLWIQTPHIGGILKVANIEAGELEVLDSETGLSNHAIGQTNLCLSVLVQDATDKVIYVPNQSRDSVVGYSFGDGKFELYETIALDVDFSVKLGEQYGFENVIETGNFCDSSN